MNAQELLKAINQLFGGVASTQKIKKNSSSGTREFIFWGVWRANTTTSGKFSAGILHFYYLSYDLRYGNFIF